MMFEQKLNTMERKITECDVVLGGFAWDVSENQRLEYLYEAVAYFGEDADQAVQAASCRGHNRKMPPLMFVKFDLASSAQHFLTSHKEALY